jgi:hypothetical protein
MESLVCIRESRIVELPVRQASGSAEAQPGREQLTLGTTHAETPSD